MQLLHRLRRILLGILREIGDENAYARHCRLHHLTPGPESYRHFQAEHYGRKYQRAKCC